MDAVAESGSGDVQIPLVSVNVIPGKPFPAMTTQATVVAELGIGRFCRDGTCKKQSKQQQKPYGKYFY
jgi:hypothetical protein